MVGRFWLDVGWQNTQRRHVAQKNRRRLCRQRIYRNALLAGAVDDLIFNVGDVGRIGDTRIGQAQQTDQNIENNSRPRVSNMR